MEVVMALSEGRPKPQLNLVAPPPPDTYYDAPTPDLMVRAQPPRRRHLMRAQPPRRRHLIRGQMRRCHLICGQTILIRGGPPARAAAGGGAGRGGLALQRDERARRRARIRR